MCNYVGPFLPLTACFLLSGLFVGSLYVWNSKYDRNHPSTIKKRFFSIFIVILISPFIFNFFITSDKFINYSTLELLGFKKPGIILAAIIPLLLTMILFLGPLCMIEVTTWQSLLHLNFWTDNLTNLVWVRNIFIGPLAEEFTFRACMLPLLLQSFSPTPSIFFCSFFFGLAHVHHMIERYQAGDSKEVLFLRAFVQFSYTTMFGAYSAFVFYKTGHFIAPFVVHAFCNIMGFPDFGRIFMYKNPKKIVLSFLFVAGVLLWYCLLEPLLNHQLYSNYIYFKY